MSRRVATDRITPAQVRAIKTLQGRLGMPDESYRAWLDESYGATSCKDLTSAQAGSALTALRRLADGDGGPRYDAQARIAEWNAEVFGARALSGFAVGGDPPTRRRIGNVAGSLWEVCRRARDPRAYLRGILRDVIGKDRIDTEAEAARVAGALWARSRKQGMPRRNSNGEKINHRGHRGTQREKEC